MELLQLQYLRTVIEQKSISRASALLHVSQPALSMVLQKLSREIGFPLFCKKGRGIELTDTGEIFWSYCSRALNTLDTGLNAIRTKGQNIIIRSKLSPIYFTNVLTAFWKEHPDVTFQIDYNQLSSRHRNYDISVWYSKEIPTDLKTICLGKERVVLCVPKEHPLSVCSEVPAEVLANEQLILLTTRYSLVDSLLHEISQATNLKLNIIMQHENKQSIEAAVCAHTGLALIPMGYYAHEAPPESVRFIPIIDPQLSLYVCMDYPHNLLDGSIIHQFSEFLIQHFQTHPPIM